MANKVLVKDLVEALHLNILAGNEGINEYVTDDEITTPGMEFAGFYTYFEPNRIILIGSKEATYLNELDEKVARERVEYLLKQNVPAVIFSKRVSVPDFFIELGNKYQVALLKSEDRTTQLTSKLYVFLRNLLAERISTHGVLMDINGLGTLITGKSGIGKSETALELIKRGHQLISDDRVDIYEKEVGTLIGEAPKTIERFLEVRGVGIVNVVELFGVGAFRDQKTIRLVIELKEVPDYSEDSIDRLGLESETIKFFNTELPKITIPVRTGRNLAVLVETAASNTKLKYMGYDATKDLVEKIGKISRGEEK